MCQTLHVKNQTENTLIGLYTFQKGLTRAPGERCSPSTIKAGYPVWRTTGVMSLYLYVYKTYIQFWGVCTKCKYESHTCNHTWNQTDCTDVMWINANKISIWVDSNVSLHLWFFIHEIIITAIKAKKLSHVFVSKLCPKSRTQLSQIILTWYRGYRDQQGGSPRKRLSHCTSVELTPAITPNVGYSGT